MSEYVVCWYLERGDEWRRRYFYTASAALDYAQHNERMGFTSTITDVYGKSVQFKEV
jgi:hypothetical protein